MAVNLWHLHTFSEVARLGSINAASLAVHLTQPAVTQAVHSLEHHFGTPLFLRSSAGMQPTPAGKICVERASRALSQLRDGVAELSSVSPRRMLNDERLFRAIRSAQLQSLSAVVEHRSFSSAARARKLSQPAIHRAARQLEQQLGALLFEKTSFGVVPTRDAERLARRARLAFAEMEQARAEIRALGGSESGRTVIGALPLARSFLVPNTLIEFAREHPEHGVCIAEGSYDQLLTALQTGETDFLIGALREKKLPPNILQEHLFDDPLSIIVRAGHPLARRKRLTARDLARYPWIAPRASSPLRAKFNALFEFLGMAAPANPVECNCLIAARSLLVESEHMMLLSAHQIHYELKAGMLISLPHPAGAVARPIGLTLRQDWRPTETQRRLIDLLRVWAKAPRARISRPSASSGVLKDAISAKKP